jgi:hypothetical protein
MINASNPSVSNASLPPPLLDQDETSIATGTNTNAAASAQAQGANALSDQGISALEYDANFSMTRDPASADNNQMLMINPNSVNPNATRANVQGQTDAKQNDLALGSSGNKLATANNGSLAAKSPNTSELANNKTEVGKLAQAAKPSNVSTQDWKNIILPIIIKYGWSAAKSVIAGFAFVKDKHNANPDISNKPNQLQILAAAGIHASKGETPGDVLVKFSAFKAAADATIAFWDRGLLV